MPVKWTRQALKNLDEIAAYIAIDNPTAAHEFLTSVFESVAQLALLPARGRPGRVAGTRELIISRYPSYIVPYRIRKNTVEVIRVFHTKQQWPPTL